MMNKGRPLNTEGLFNMVERTLHTVSDHVGLRFVYAV